MENRDLYRGKRIDNGKWAIGFYLKPLEEYGNGERVAEIVPLEAIQHFEWVSPTLIVDPSTICQCTGYEGIYEKDIFRYEDEEYVIKWSDDSLSWEATSLETDVSVPLGELNPDYMVVIGNEIDNPELLE